MADTQATEELLLDVKIAEAPRIYKFYLNQEKKILDRDPFASIDTVGTGGLVAIAVEKGRKARPDIKLGICGEHGGDPDSIGFFQLAGLDYVSCSPYRVPVARVAAAQAAVAEAADDDG